MTRLRIQLNFEIEAPCNVEECAAWAGLPLVESGINHLIDTGVIGAPVKLFEGVYRRVENAEEVPARKRRRP